MITLDLEKGIYYIKENGKTLMTLHYGYSGHQSPEEKSKRLNINIGLGVKKQITELHMNTTGQLLIGLDEKEIEA